MQKFLLIVFLLSTIPLSGQNLCYVYFKDKPAGIVEEETEYHDRLMNRNYIEAIQKEVGSIRHELKWLNAVTISATNEQISQISSFPFVAKVQLFRLIRQQLNEVQKVDISEDTARLNNLLNLQRKSMELDGWNSLGITGKGIRIAILDAGFKEANTHPALEHVRQAGRIIATKDFYAGGKNVYRHSRHGTTVMSCIAGKYNNKSIGCAPNAEFLLARTEHETKEPEIEEDHWLAALEWAVENDADILTSSVTFTQKRYTYEDMDGETTPVSKGAAIAVKKGLVIVCSMGNEGESSWKYMGAPADVKEVISVGGAFPMLPMRIKFSSIGPNFAQEIKPDVAAPGFVVAADKNGKYDEHAGTSFSAPLVAGFVACMKELYPDWTVGEVQNQLRKSAHLWPYYDYELGFGIPQVSKLVQKNPTAVSPSFQVGFKGDSVILKFDPIILNKDSTDFPQGKVLYYHLETSDGKLTAAFEILIPLKSQYYFFRQAAEAKGTLRIWFEGYLFEQKLE